MNIRNCANKFGHPINITSLSFFLFKIIESSIITLNYNNVIIKYSDNIVSKVKINRGKNHNKIFIFK